jgi:hypothetical protein
VRLQRTALTLLRGSRSRKNSKRRDRYDVRENAAPPQDTLECGGSATAFDTPARARNALARSADSFLAPPKPRRHSEERFSRRRISSMLQRPVHRDEVARRDGLPTYDRMRRFAALRMTRACGGPLMKALRARSSVGVRVVSKAAAEPPHSTMSRAANRSSTLRDPLQRGQRRSRTPQRAAYSVTSGNFSMCISPLRPK